MKLLIDTTNYCTACGKIMCGANSSIYIAVHIGSEVYDYKKGWLCRTCVGKYKAKISKLFKEE